MPTSSNTDPGLYGSTVRAADATGRVNQAPRSRGPLSAWVIDHMWHGSAGLPPAVPADGFGADVQLALYLAYENHFEQLGWIDEWDTKLISFRRHLEDAFIDELRRRIEPTGSARGEVGAVISELIAADTSPSVSRHMERDGTIEQLREFVLHRSAYQLKEGDAHTMAIGRIPGRAKQILAAIQAGEYGADEPDRAMHSALFAQTMRGLGLDDRPNAYLDVLPASALMVSNLVSLFGLNRRWRGALVGHLAVFEMTSVEPMGRYANGAERMGAGPDVRRFYDVHVLADAEHEHMALEMARALAHDDPDLTPDIIFGAQSVLTVEREFAATLLRAWRVGENAQAA